MGMRRPHAFGRNTTANGLLFGSSGRRVWMTFTKIHSQASSTAGCARGDLLELVFSGISDPVMVLDRDLHVVDCNDAALRCLSESFEGVNGRLWASLYPQPQQDARDSDMSVVVNEGVEWQARIPVIDPVSGSSLLYDVKSYPVRSGRRETDPVINVVVYMHEVTDEVRTYLELVDRNRELQLIKENLEARADKLDHENRALADDNSELRGQNNRLHELALVDVMTGLPNYRSFCERLHSELKHAVMTGKPLSLLVFDVDNFKQYNDLFGHPQGDDLLREMSLVVRDSVRSSDFPARYGGEEFAVLLPRTDKFGAVVVAERLRTRIESHKMPNRRTTISIGIAEFPSDTKGVDDIIDMADKAMYVAKSYGKNTSCLWSRDRYSRSPGNAGSGEAVRDAECVPVHNSTRPQRARTDVRILLVDKDELLLTTLRDELQEQGYKVSTANCGRMALVKLAEASGAFDVMITELVLSDRTGFELKEQAMALHPGLPVVYMSALQSNVKPRTAFDEKVYHLAKPVPFSDILAVLNKIVGPPRREPVAA